MSIAKPSSTPVEVTAKDLLGEGVVACPNPKMPLWSNHPRVFLNVVKAEAAKCPYCGTEYQLKAGEKIHTH